MLDSGDSGETFDAGTTDTHIADAGRETADTGPLRDAHAPADTSAGPSLEASAATVDTGTTPTPDTGGAGLQDTATPQSFDTLATQAKHNAVDHAIRNSVPGRQAELEALRNEPNNARLGPTHSPKALGSHNMETGEIVCRNGLTNAQAAHVAQHEFTHKASFQDLRTTETADTIQTEKTSGIHTVVRETNKATGEITTVRDSYRSLNEGFTERETLATEKEVYGQVTSCGLKCYSLNMDYAAQLETLVGRDTVTAAYYSGDLKGMTDAVNRLAQDETAWNSLNEKLDALCNPKDNLTPQELGQLVCTRMELDTLMAQMAQNKAQLEAAKQNGGNI